MRSSITLLLLAAGILGILPGCAIVPSGDLPLAAESDARDPPPVAIGGVRLDPESIPGYADMHTTVPLPQLSGETRPMTAAECACLAAARCQLAAVLDEEAASLRREVQSGRRHGPSRLLPGIVADRAEKERNDVAAQALTAYYQLADVHLQSAILTESYRELGRVTETVDALREAGIAVNTDRSALARRKSKLDLQNTQLLINESRLTSLVKTLVGDDPMSPEGIETNCSIEPMPAGYSLQVAIEIARQNDFELKTLRKLIKSGRAEDLGLARKLLQTASPFLGQEPGRAGLIAKVRTLFGYDDRDDQEMCVRKKQLRELHDARQQQLDLEVADAVVSIQERFLDVSIAKDVFDSWEGRLAALQSNREIQKSEYQDLVDARAQLLKARSELQHKAIQLEIAHVKLRALMGLLARECAEMQLPRGEMDWSPLHGPCRVTGLSRDRLRR